MEVRARLKGGVAMRHLELLLLVLKIIQIAATIWMIQAQRKRQHRRK
jgi:hypothetical protein